MTEKSCDTVWTGREVFSEVVVPLMGSITLSPSTTSEFVFAPAKLIRCPVNPYRKVLTSPAPNNPV